MAPRFTHVRLLVSDYAAVFTFYRDIMHLEVAWGDESSGYADLRGDTGFQLAIFERSRMGDLVDGDHTGHQVALIFAVDDVDTFVTGAHDRGAEVIAEAQDRPDWGIRTAHLRDPASTLIEVNSPLPRSEWSPGLLQADGQHSDR